VHWRVGWVVVCGLLPFFFDIFVFRVFIFFVFVFLYVYGWLLSNLDSLPTEFPALLSLPSGGAFSSDILVFDLVSGFMGGRV